MSTIVPGSHCTFEDASFLFFFFLFLLQILSDHLHQALCQTIYFKWEHEVT